MEFKNNQLIEDVTISIDQHLSDLSELYPLPTDAIGDDWNYIQQNYYLLIDECERTIQDKHA